ncbi:MAG TPA: phospholipase D family protein [Syntrophales bacterium]|nr:phospholipase D family protein [Syntrophales bacterium]
MLLTSPAGDSAILCSGYIWQPNDGRYNVLDDGLRQSILAGCAGGTLTTIAGKFYPDYYEVYYRNFIEDLRYHGINVVPFYAPKKNWHAKIAIRTNNHHPVAALVGSSNLTGPAYGIRRNWNYEADVLIWMDADRQTGFFRDDGMDMPLGRFELILDPHIEQPSEELQLKGIYADVMETELQDFV